MHTSIVAFNYEMGILISMESVELASVLLEQRSCFAELVAFSAQSDEENVEVSN